MGQITKEFAEAIVRKADLNQHSSLTCWEQKQLAIAWLKLREQRISEAALSLVKLPIGGDTAAEAQAKEKP